MLVFAKHSGVVMEVAPDLRMAIPFSLSDLLELRRCRSDAKLLVLLVAS